MRASATRHALIMIIYRYREAFIARTSSVILNRFGKELVCSEKLELLGSALGRFCFEPVTRDQAIKCTSLSPKTIYNID